MRWFELNIHDLETVVPGTTLREKHINAVDLKYGEYDLSYDLRLNFEEELVKRLSQVLARSMRLESEGSLLLAGANRGFELDYFKDYDVTAVDLSPRAIKSLKRNKPKVPAFQMDLDHLDFSDSTFDCYVSLRTFQTTGVQLEKAISEAIRVVRPDGSIVISIPNGYWLDEKVVRGFYLSKMGIFDEKAPYQCVGGIETFFRRLGFSTKIIEVPSELLLVAENRI